jgi:hypothetical protein
MVYQYVVTLQNNSRRLIDRFSILLCLASVVLFLLEYITDKEKRLVHLIGILLIIFLSGINLYKSRKINRYNQTGQAVNYNYILFITALVWATMPYFPWLSGMFLILGLVERQAKKNLEIGFADDRIVFNSFPRKQYDWKDFSNIVLRDNLLTLDFRNNKLFQRETIDEEGDAGEEEFNNYCEERIGLSENF